MFVPPGNEYDSPGICNISLIKPNNVSSPLTRDPRLDCIHNASPPTDIGKGLLDPSNKLEKLSRTCN